MTLGDWSNEGFGRWARVVCCSGEIIAATGRKWTPEAFQDPLNQLSRRSLAREYDRSMTCTVLDCIYAKGMLGSNVNEVVMRSRSRKVRYHHDANMMRVHVTLGDYVSHRGFLGPSLEAQYPS